MVQRLDGPHTYRFCSGQRRLPFLGLRLLSGNGLRRVAFYCCVAPPSSLSFGPIFLHYSAPAQTAREFDRPHAQLEEPNSAKAALCA